MSGINYPEWSEIAEEILLNSIFRELRLLYKLKAAERVCELAAGLLQALEAQGVKLVTDDADWLGQALDEWREVR
jgi:hypothetical protein